MDLYLGIDAGGSSIKGVLASLDGKVYASEKVEYRIESPHTGWAEQDGTLWWEGTKKILGGIVTRFPEVRHSLRGIMVGGMVPNLLPLDENGNPVRPAILYRDNRAVRECKRTNESFGFSFNMQDIIPKWLWMKMHEPENFEKTRMILGTHSYIVYKLTGIPSIDTDTATLFGEGIFTETGKWNREPLDMLGLPAGVLPPAYRPAETVGLVSESIKERFGFTGDIPVLAGIGDSLAAMLGTGAVNRGDGMIYLGTAATLWYIDRNLSSFARGNIFGSGHLHFAANVLAGGELVNWFCSSLQLEGEDIQLEELEEEAEKIRPGSEELYFLPHLLGMRTPYPDPLATGSMQGITPVHTGYHLYRALLEGVAYNLYESYLASGKKATRLLVTGGGARSSLWRSILADLFGIPVNYYPDGDGALGLACFAAYALDDISDFSVLEDKWLGRGVILEPDKRRHEIYAGKYGVYKKLNSRMNEFYTILAGEDG